MGSYNITTSIGQINVSLEGSFTPENAQNFVKDFKTEVTKVNPATCHLVLDGTRLAISPAQMVDLLRNCFAMYKGMGFKRITMNPGSNVVLRMQVSRLAKEAGLTGFELK